MSFLLMLLMQAGVPAAAPAPSDDSSKDGKVYWGLLEKNRRAPDPNDPLFVRGERPKEFKPVDKSVSSIGFDRMDRNHDGIVDKKEIQFEFRARYRSTAMPASEFQRKERQHIAMLLGTYDKDKSGSISKDEMHAAETRRAKTAPRLKGQKSSIS